MPRGKYVNHKGKCRQFTPPDLLEQEFELSRRDVQRPVNTSSSDTESDTDSEPIPTGSKKVGVEALIEISNPNRKLAARLQKSMQLTDKMPEEKQESTAGSQRRRDRQREKTRARDVQRSYETKSDLARLALIRKEREAAAERRLAAKQEAVTAALSAGPHMEHIKRKPIVATAPSDSKTERKGK